MFKNNYYSKILILIKKLMKEINIILKIIINKSKIIKIKKNFLNIKILLY